MISFFQSKKQRFVAYSSIIRCLIFILWTLCTNINVWTRAYLILEQNWTVRRQEEGKNSLYLFIFCMNLGEINALLTISCYQKNILAMSSYINWEISDNVPQNDNQLDPNPEFRLVSLWIAHIEWNEMYWRNDWWIKMTRIVTLCF
jgi:hypothetical protein